MTRHRIEISRTAEKQLKKLPRDLQRRLARAMEELAADPHPPGSRKLTGHDDVYRVRVGTYRVIYSVARRKLIVIILKRGHRKDVYR